MFTKLLSADLIGGVSKTTLNEVLPSRANGLTPAILRLAGSVTQIYETCSRCNRWQHLPFKVNDVFGIGRTCATYLAVLIEVQKDLRSIRNIAIAKGPEEEMTKLHRRITELIHGFKLTIRHPNQSFEVMILLGRNCVQAEDLSESCQACGGTGISYLCDDVSGPCMEC